MKIREHYYCEDNRTLHVEFSTKEDGDDFYRELKLEYWDIEYYSPTIVVELDLKKMNKNFIIELLEQYENENELPEQQTL